MRQVDRVAGAGVVDVVALLVRQQPVVAGVVDALERQRRPELVALGGVVVDDVEDHLDAGVVKLGHHLLEFADRSATAGSAARARRSRSSCSPSSSSGPCRAGSCRRRRRGSAAARRGDAERAQIVRDFGLASPAKVPRSASGTGGCSLREAVDVRLVDDRALPRTLRLRDAPQVKAGSMTRHFGMNGALSRSSKDRSVGVLEPVAEQLGVPAAARRRAAWHRDRAAACWG